MPWPYPYDIGTGTVDPNKLLADYSTYPFRPPLVFNAILMGTATAHTADMIGTGVLSHDGSDGSTPEARLHAAGYPPDLSGKCCNGSTYAGEPSVPSFDAWEMHAIYQYDLGNPGPATASSSWTRTLSARSRSASATVRSATGTGGRSEFSVGKHEEAVALARLYGGLPRPLCL